MTENPRCSITGNPCGTDTWCKDQEPDCRCGNYERQHRLLYAENSAVEAKRKALWYKLVDSLQENGYRLGEAQIMADVTMDRASTPLTPEDVIYAGDISGYSDNPPSATRRCPNCKSANIVPHTQKEEWMVCKPCGTEFVETEL